MKFKKIIKLSDNLSKIDMMISVRHLKSKESIVFNFNFITKKLIIFATFPPVLLSDSIFWPEENKFEIEYYSEIEERKYKLQIINKLSEKDGEIC